MAVLTGSEGAVKIGTHTVLHIENWKADLGGGLTVEDTPGFGQTAKERIKVGLETMDGTFNGSINNADTDGQMALRTAALGKSTVSLKLYESSTVYHECSALIEPISLDVSPETKGNISFSFKSTGTITHTTS